MDSDYREEMKRGAREDLIRRDLEGGKTVPLKDLIRKHPKSSVHYVTKKLKERKEGRFIKVERNGKLVRAFQLVEKKAPYEEVELLIQLLSEANPVEIRRAAASINVWNNSG